ncbi:MAG: Mlp family lipoprotein, partial [Bacteroidota bacterium]
NPYYPFSIGDTSTEYDLYIVTQDPKIMGKYSPMFKRHGLSYTVNVWEDLLQQLLKQMNDTVAAAVITNVDGEILRIGTENKSHRAKFLDWMHEMLTNNKRFDAFLKSEDPSVAPIPTKKKKEDDND